MPLPLPRNHTCHPLNRYPAPGGTPAVGDIIFDEYNKVLMKVDTIRWGPDQEQLVLDCLYFEDGEFHADYIEAQSVSPSDVSWVPTLRPRPAPEGTCYDDQGNEVPDNWLDSDKYFLTLSVNGEETVIHSFKNLPDDYDDTVWEILGDGFPLPDDFPIPVTLKDLQGVTLDQWFISKPHADTLLSRNRSSNDN